MAVIKSDAYGHILPNIVKDIDDIVDGYGAVSYTHLTLPTICSV